MNVNDLQSLNNALKDIPITVFSGNIAPQNIPAIVLDGIFGVSWAIELDQWGNLSVDEFVALCTILYHMNPDTNFFNVTKVNECLQGKIEDKYTVIQQLVNKHVLKTTWNNDVFVTDRGIHRVSLRTKSRKESELEQLRGQPVPKKGAKIILFPTSGLVEPIEPTPIVPQSVKSPTLEGEVSYQLLLSAGKILDKIMTMLNYTDFRVIIQSEIAELLQVSPNDVGAVMKGLLDNSIIVRGESIKGKRAYKLNSQKVRYKRSPILREEIDE